MSECRGAIIFDGDDTLWQTQIFYDQARERFFKLMASCGFDREAVKSKLAEIDVDGVERFGFSRCRFPTSLEETYRYFCRSQGRFIYRAVLRQAWEIGNSVFYQTPKPMNDARQVLERLSWRYCLYLYTGGDLHVQWRKLKDLNLAHYFEAVHVRERKNEAELRNILCEHGLDPDKTWMIGNSPRSDINPALRLGLKCIWVRGAFWEHDEEPLISSDIPQVDSLRELLGLFELEA